MYQQPGPFGPDAAVTHILVVTDPGLSRDFWVDVLGRMAAELIAHVEAVWHRSRSGEPEPAKAGDSFKSASRRWQRRTSLRSPLGRWSRARVVRAPPGRQRWPRLGSSRQ